MRGSGAVRLAAPPGRPARYLPHSRKLQTCSSRRSTIWKVSRRICCCASSACGHRAATASDPSRPTRPPSAQPPAPHQVPVEADEPRLAVVVEHQDGVDHPGGCTTRPEPEPEPGSGGLIPPHTHPGSPPPFPEARRSSGTARPLLPSAPPGGATATARRYREGRGCAAGRAPGGHTHAAGGRQRLHEDSRPGQLIGCRCQGRQSPLAEAAAGIVSARSDWLRPGGRGTSGAIGAIGRGPRTAAGIFLPASSDWQRLLGAARPNIASERGLDCDKRRVLALRLAEAAASVASARCDWRRLRGCREDRGRAP